MFETQIVFIVGAGASCKLGFPAADKLTGIIREMTRDEHGDSKYRALKNAHLAQAITSIARRSDDPTDKKNELYRATVAINQGMDVSPSIDTFIDTHSERPEIAEVGKLAIVQAILEAEFASKLCPQTDVPSDRPNLGPLRETWYRPWFQMLITVIREDAMEAVFRNVSVITFNYDRCIEAYLVHALRANFDADEERVFRLMSEAPIHHAYGAVGSLKGSSDRLVIQRGQAPPVRFGDRTERVDLVSVAPHLRTFTEEVGSSEEVARMRRLVAGAETIVFLGFGFNDDNLALIRPEEGVRSRCRRIFATALGASEPERASITSTLKHWARSDLLGDNKIHVGAWGCSELFHEFRTALPGPGSHLVSQ